jgi:hypothetical protein
MQRSYCATFRQNADLRPRCAQAKIDIGGDTFQNLICSDDEASVCVAQIPVMLPLSTFLGPVHALSQLRTVRLFRSHVRWLSLTIVYAAGASPES